MALSERDWRITEFTQHPLTYLYKFALRMRLKSIPISIYGYFQKTAIKVTSSHKVRTDAKLISAKYLSI